MARTGRPSIYRAAIARQICVLVAGGSNLSRICRRKGMPSKDAVYAWLRGHPEFADDYARAREDRADGRNDRIDDICRRVEGKKLDPNAARVMIDALKWQAAHEAPKRYSDRIELAGDSQGGPAIQLVVMPAGTPEQTS